MKNRKILIISLGHPDFSKGGAETAAYNLYKGLRENGEDVTFLARTDKLPHGGSYFSRWKDDNELLIHCSMHDFFNFSTENKSFLVKEFREFLKRLNPYIIHFHHYIHFGLEFFREVKFTLPSSKLILTLHEYLAICNHNGQMVKTGTNHKLCYESSPVECSDCFPDKTPADFFLREKYIKSYLTNVDFFISPSNFLIERYVKWGLNSEKMKMIENAQPESNSFIPRKLDSEYPYRNRFAFFGQLNPYKGIDVLLAAFAKLPKKTQKNVFLDIYGANLEMQSEEFKTKISKLLDNVKSDSVQFHGVYEPHEMPALIEQTDWVIIPSIWWENSPMVIQEVFNHGRPIIGSNIGGIKEKIENKGGLLFQNRDSFSLRNVILDALSDDIWKEKVSDIKNVSFVNDIVKKHLSIYFINENK